MSQQELTFVSVDPNSAPHAVAEGAVQTATNVDFSGERGAATVRRGSTLFSTTPSGVAIKTLFRHYSNPHSIDSSVFYLTDANGATFRTANATSYGVLGTGGGQDLVGYSAYREYAYIASGTNHWKDNGTNATEWIKQTPPAITSLSAYGGTNYIGAVFTAAEGTVTYTGSTNVGVTDANNRVTFLCAGTNLGTTNLAVFGSNTIGNYGANVLDIGFSNPSVVNRVSWDFSIGDATFLHRFHTEADTTTEINGGLDLDALLSELTTVGTSTVPLSSDTLAEIKNSVADLDVHVRVVLGGGANTITSWVVPRTQWQLVGTAGTSTASNDLWANIQAARVVVEASEPVTAYVMWMGITGGELYPLNAPIDGYTYWQTFATVDSSGNVVSESAPSAATGPVKCQWATTTMNLGTGPTGTSHGITHRVIYRQGGFAPVAYAVGTQTLTTTTFLDSVSDLESISGQNRLMTDMWAQSNWPGDVVAISEPFFDRLFLGYENKLSWSLPGQPDVIPKTSYARVSFAGDEIQGLVVWDRLVIVNRDSVYEMGGSVFEGTGADWTLQRSGSRRGSRAPRTIIKTPAGIPLLDYDGISMYLPGRGVDTSLDWANDQMADAWKGIGSTDPVALKGSRIPAINKSYLRDSVAAFADDKLYLGTPTGTASTASTLWVIDFRTQKVWWYTYPFAFTSLFWDFVDNRLLAGSTDGKLMRLEVGLVDTTTAGASQGIPFSLRTRAWTTPSDTVLENIALEYAGGTGTLQAYYDGGTAVALGTLTNSVKDWLIPPLNGTIANNVVFEITGTQGTSARASLYGLHFDALVEPQRVFYFRTEHTVEQGERLWDVAYSDIDILGTGTVTAVTFVDGTGTLTRSLVGPTPGRQRLQGSFPSETYGQIAYSTYTSIGTATGTGTATGSTTAVVFKHWTTTYDSRQEPPKINSWKTDIQSLEENICEGVDWDVNPAGTMTSTVFVDNTAVSTFTTTGTKRQSFTNSLPNDTYGRTLYVLHTGTGFKHYRTWFHLRQEPDRWLTYTSPRESGPEAIWDAAECDIDPLGNTVTATAFVDGTGAVVGTLTGSFRQSYPMTIAGERYGRTAWVKYVSTPGRFKHYNTWWSKRVEPDRLSTYISDREYAPGENWYHRAMSAMDCLGNTVIKTIFVDGTGIGTFTLTGSGQSNYSDALPEESYGGVIYTQYVAVTGRFKHYKTWYESDDEPDRVRFYESEVKTLPSENYVKTWLAELNPIGQTVTATCTIDGIAISTQTATGSRRQIYEWTLPELQTGKTIKASYRSTGNFKHYDSQWECEPKPFAKTNWLVTYRKIGGATQLDMPRYGSLEIEGTGTYTLTSILDIDGVAFTTHTLTMTNREYRDRIPLPPGARGYIFQQRLSCSTPIRVWRSNLDIERIGVKGLSRVGYKGTPNE